MATSPIAQPDRYVVLIWLYDHWGVSFTTNDKTEAVASVLKAKEQVLVPVIGVDTEQAETI